MEEKLQQREGVYAVSGNCPHCQKMITVHISIDNWSRRSIKITPEKKEKIDAELGKISDVALAAKYGVSIAYVNLDETEQGSVVGRLETINIHGKNTFYIYPILGPKRVKCEFAGSLKDSVKQALGERVEVEGNLMYKSWDKFPHAISVDRMETFPSDDKLPTFSELVGIAPDATGEMTATEFVRKLRDEER